MTSKKFIFLLICILSFSCTNQPKIQQLKQEVLDTESAFEKLCADSGIAVGFVHFADDSAVILRANDSLIRGKQAIAHYYQATKNNASVMWTPDYVDVSADGTMAYTYGNYIWTVTDSLGNKKEYKGVFHTVWKKQRNGNWKYVWD